jgi:hypothetical protein
LGLAQSEAPALAEYVKSALCLAGFALGAAASLWLLLRLKADLFELALASTTRMAEKRLRLRQGRAVVELASGGLRSVALPRPAWFRGLGAITA